MLDAPKKKLKTEEIAALTDWVKRGAFWPEPRPGVGSRSVANLPSTTTGATHAASVSAQDKSFWSFQPVSNPAPPSVKDSAWPYAAIDRFILAKLEANGLAPAPRADKATLIRRAFFDLIGLPPTPEEIDAFLKDDRPTAFATVVERLLASPHYGDAVGRYWLDLGGAAEIRPIQFNPGPNIPTGCRYSYDWLRSRVPQSRPALRPTSSSSRSRAT